MCKISFAHSLYFFMGVPMQASQIITLIAVALTMFGVIGFLFLLAHYYTLNGIKSRTVGDGQWHRKVCHQTGNPKDLLPSPHNAL